jgi:perosamine synthetase
MNVALMQPYITDAMRRGVQDVLHTRWIGQGERVDEFEQRFSEYVGRPCVAVNSGTSALHLAYILAGIKPGDTVLAPIFTCTAANEPLLHMGVNIRFVDVEKGGLNMCPDDAERLMDDWVKAVAVVNYGGKRAGIFGNWADVPMIEDCAQSLGAGGCNGSAYQCYSFQAVKAVTTGDGGMLALPERQVDEAKRLRWFGIDRKAKLAGTWENDIREVGYKYQMTDIAASMGLASLDRLDYQVGVRRAMRDLYVYALRGLDGIRVIDQDPGSACWLLTVCVERREDLMAKLKERGIENGLVHYRNDRYSIFEQFRRPGEFPNMDWMESRYLCIPLHMGMGCEEVEYICHTIREGW